MVSFSIATLQAQLLSPLSRPQLVLSGKLVPSQRADAIVAGKSNFLETMSFRRQEWAAVLRACEIGPGPEFSCEDLARTFGSKPADQAALSLLTAAVRD